MSDSKSSEIQFVRCPSCNSLVPTTATRCRMCGFDLAGSGAKEDAPKSTGGRVTQKTMTIGADKVKNIKISAHESDDESAEATLKETPSEAIKQPKAPINKQQISERFSRKTPDQQMQSPQQPSIVQKQPLDVTLNNQENVRQQPAKRQPVKQQPAPQTSTNTQTLGRSNAANSENQVQQQLQNQVQGQIKRPNKTIDRANENQLKPRRMTAQNSQNQNEQNFDSSPQNNTKNNKGVVVPSSYANNKLVGWLVDYNEFKAGSSSEIRQGRYLVCGEKLRPSDITIEADGISTPHCLISATQKDGIKIIDLESDKGTYLRRGRGESKKIERIDVQNGDYVKFGSYEVKFCIITQDQDPIEQKDNHKKKTDKKKNNSTKKESKDIETESESE